MNNRITLQDLEDNIVDENYFTAFEGVGVHYPASVISEELKRVTICVLELKNGFVVVGDSACVDLSNFDANLGRTAAKANAVSKVWALMGYELKSKLAV